LRLGMILLTKREGGKREESKKRKWKVSNLHLESIPSITYSNLY
jgi:hypothetical protein